jgi:hypothetical protein
MNQHWLKAVQEMMQRTRLPFHECCRRVGRRGGAVGAKMKRAQAVRRLKEEAMGLV